MSTIMAWLLPEVFHLVLLYKSEGKTTERRRNRFFCLKLLIVHIAWGKY